MTTADRSPTIHTSGKVKLGQPANVWTEPGGDLYGIAQLGGVNIVFHDPAQVRDLIAYLAGLAGEMDAEITRQQPAVKACSDCGATGTPLDGEGVCWNTQACDKRREARDAEAAQAGAR